MDRYMGCSQNYWPLLVVDSILAQFGHLRIWHIAVRSKLTESS